MDLISIPANPVPEGAIVGEVKAADGMSLRFARWPAPPGRRGTVCLFQGRAEFIEKYFEVVNDLLSRRFAVVTLDWRGQGLSQRALADPRKGHVRNFAEYGRDLDALMRQVVLPDCPAPHFALAHSMGGAILLQAAAEGRRWFDRTVLSTPMIGLTGRAMSVMARSTARFMSLMGMGGSYVPAGGASAVNSLPFVGNVLTSDPVRYARASALIDAHPALGLGSPTIAWLNAAYRLMGKFAVPTYPRALRQPILMVAAGLDDVVSTPAIEQFAIRMRAGSHVIIPGARHEILMEQDHLRAQFWAAFDAFIPGSERSDAAAALTETS